MLRYADPQKPKTSSGNAFDDILYNSDSDIGTDDDDDRPAQSQANGKGKGQAAKQGKKDKREKSREGQAYIKNEGDEPMDLLSRSIAGGISSEYQYTSSAGDQRRSLGVPLVRC